MQINLRTLLFVLPLFAASCSDAPDSVQPARTINVTVGSCPGIDIQTRTAFGEDGTVQWSSDDQIALWAVNASNEVKLSAHAFSLWHYNAEFNAAKFSAEILALPEDVYTYYAVSPCPKSATSPSEVLFEIPEMQWVKVSEQDTDNPRIPYDIMVATPVQGSELHAGDNSDAINLAFRHKVHILKIIIPENKMQLPVTTLEITFPKPVTGILTVDATAPDATPTLREASNTVLLNFSRPVDAGSTVYAAIAPVQIDASDEITFKAYAGMKESLPVTMRGKNFAESHTTPIRLTIPEIHHITHIIFSLDGDGTTTLGEKINSFTLTGPADVDLGNGSNTRTFTTDSDDNEYRLSFEGVFNDNLSGKEFTVSYDSENATVTRKFTMQQLNTDESNILPDFTVPYLFEEDFSTISGDFSGSSATGNAGGTELSKYGLPGWYAGARSQGYSDSKSVDIRHYNNLFGPYESRIDSAPIKNIKAGKTVRVKVVFNADWKKNNCTYMNLLVGRTGTEHKLNTAINDQTSVPMDNNSDASKWDIPTKQTVYIGNFTNTQSIAWKSSSENKGAFNYEDIFIDNIQVSIAQ